MYGSTLKYCSCRVHIQNQAQARVQAKSRDFDFDWKHFLAGGRIGEQVGAGVEKERKVRRRLLQRLARSR